MSPRFWVVNAVGDLLFCRLLSKRWSSPAVTLPPSASLDRRLPPTLPAGFFLFVVQPFRIGDRVAVSTNAPGAAGGAPLGPASERSWFEGVCEKVDLRWGQAWLRLYKSSCFTATAALAPACLKWHSSSIDA